MKSQESEICANSLVEDVLEKIVKQVIQVEGREKLDEDNTCVEGETPKETISIKEKTEHGSDEPVGTSARTNCEKIREHPKLICFLIFCLICGIALSICGASGVFNCVQNVPPSKGEESEISPESLDKTRNEQDSKEIPKQVDLLTRDTPHSNYDQDEYAQWGEARRDYLAYEPPSRVKKIDNTILQRVFQRNKVMSIINLTLNAFFYFANFEASTTGKYAIIFSIITAGMFILIAFLVRNKPNLQVVVVIFLYGLFGVALTKPNKFGSVIGQFMGQFEDFITPWAQNIISGLGLLRGLSTFFVFVAVVFNWVSYFRMRLDWSQFWFLFLAAIPIVSILLGFRDVQSFAAEDLAEDFGEFIEKYKFTICSDTVRSCTNN